MSEFLVLVRIADGDLEQETVELGFRELIGAFLVDRVLGGQHEERFGQRIGAVAEGDLALLHGFQQGGLHLGGGAVDFVGEDQVVEDRPEFGFEFHGLRMIDHGAHEVRGQQVRRELEAGERSRQRSRERLDGQGFGEAGHPFQQNVAVAQQADQQAVHQAFLAHQDPSHFILHRLDPAAGFHDTLLQVFHCHRFRGKILA